MKIEKISDNQIRFTLTGEDLAARQIKLSELAYGTEKARNLFREMMQQAASQVGFEADNIPDDRSHSHERRQYRPRCDQG